MREVDFMGIERWKEVSVEDLQRFRVSLRE